MHFSILATVCIWCRERKDDGLDHFAYRSWRNRTSCTNSRTRAASRYHALQAHALDVTQVMRTLNEGSYA
jgi:hypothetical protein